MYKKVNVVMLPTNEKAKIGYLTAKGREFKDLRVFDKEMPIILDSENFHLYITSDDEIKEGDWYIDTVIKNNTVVKQCKKEYRSLLDSKYCNKIIATTDSSLMITKSVPHSSPNNVSGKRKEKIVEKLSQIPQSFIERYVSEYNKGNVITEVMVEFTSYHGINTSVAEINAVSGDNSMNWKGVGDNRDFKLKLNQDNTINIKNVKDSYSREEVVSLLNKLNHQLKIVSEVKYANEITLEQWIEENL